MTSLNLVMRNFNRLLENNPSHLQSDDSYSVVEHCSHCVKPRSYYGFNWLDCTGWYLVVLGQNRTILVASMISFQKIYGLHGLDHQIIEYSPKEKVITDTQTDRHTEFPLVDSTPSVEGVE